MIDRLIDRYHLDSSTDLTYDGKTLHVSLIPNPSHLEVNRISDGFVFMNKILRRIIPWQ